jgi:hypothetical protein
MARRRSRQLLESDRFQASVISLLRVAHADWNEWEQDWLLDEARRPNDYIYSERVARYPQSVDCLRHDVQPLQ